MPRCLNLYLHWVSHAPQSYESLIPATVGTGYKRARSGILSLNGRLGAAVIAVRVFEVMYK